MRKFLLVPLLVFLSGCAVQKSKAPQISQATADRLNFANLIQQAQADYVSFFQDVGKRMKAGQLTSGQVAQLNAIGTGVQTALDSAGSLDQTYETSYDQPTAVKIQQYIAQAAAIFAQIYSLRASMLSGNLVTKPAGP